MNSSMTIINAQYQTDVDKVTNVFINVTIDGQQVTVPMDPDNRHYAEILRQVAAGTITIEDAD